MGSRGGSRDVVREVVAEQFCRSGDGVADTYAKGGIRYCCLTCVGVVLTVSG